MLESGSVNANKNTGNIAQMVMTVAGIANPIVQNYKYDSLYRLIEGEEKNNTTENAGQNWTLPARPAAERRQSLAVRRKPTESDRIPNPSRRATAHRILDFRFWISPTRRSCAFTRDRRKRTNGVAISDRSEIQNRNSKNRPCRRSRDSNL
ncbi:MAG: hypothetical protein IPJ30_26410 [Acidobacteria bacterium]|nr:hypothetical protein [Acidobacteriota bacterium]